MKYQWVEPARKTSLAICSIEYSTLLYVNSPLLKLKSPLATNLLDTPVIFVSLGSKQLKSKVLLLAPPMYFELIVSKVCALSTKYFATEDQCLSLRYLSLIASSFNQILFILVLDKKPSLSKGLASKLTTWSSEDKSNSFKLLISAKALLPMCWRLFGKTSLLDSRSSHFLNFFFSIFSIPSLKLMPMISFLVPY